MSASSFRSPIKSSIGGHQTADVLKTRRNWLQLIGASLVLAGCGKKGDLELPPVENAEPSRSESGETQ
jgi:predicted small lipoprotein YifL